MLLNRKVAIPGYSTVGDVQASITGPGHFRICDSIARLFFNSPFSQLSKAEVSDDALDRRREHAATRSRSCYRRPDHGIRRFAIATNAGGRVARVLATVCRDSNRITRTLSRGSRAVDHGADGAGLA